MGRLFCKYYSRCYYSDYTSSLSAGDIVVIKDYAGTFATNNLTVARNGSNIDGVAMINFNYRSISNFCLCDATQGWISQLNQIQSSMDHFLTATGGTLLLAEMNKIHTFTGPGTFTVSCAGNAAGSNTVDYIVVAVVEAGVLQACSGQVEVLVVLENLILQHHSYTASPLGAVSGITSYSSRLSNYSRWRWGAARVPASCMEVMVQIQFFNNTSAGGGGGVSISWSVDSGGSGGGGGGNGPGISWRIR